VVFVFWWAAPTCVPPPRTLLPQRNPCCETVGRFWHLFFCLQAFFSLFLSVFLIVVGSCRLSFPVFFPPGVGRFGRPSAVPLTAAMKEVLLFFATFLIDRCDSIARPLFP